MYDMLLHFYCLHVTASWLHFLVILSSTIICFCSKSQSHSWVSAKNLFKETICGYRFSSILWEFRWQSMDWNGNGFVDIVIAAWWMILMTYKARSMSLRSFEANHFQRLAITMNNLHTWCLLLITHWIGNVFIFSFVLCYDFLATLVLYMCADTHY